MTRATEARVGGPSACAALVGLGRPAWVLLVCALLPGLLAHPRTGDAEAPKPALPSDPRASAIADQVLEALGGRDSWEQTRFLRFAFAFEKNGKELSRRTHLWDRWAGRLRYETTGKDGRSIVVLLDLTSRTGTVFQAGRPLDPPHAKPLLEEAYEAWINDTYWLLMPYKMKDPGVRLEDAGETSIGGESYDRVRLTFDHVGLTPGDRYWAYINRRTHRMDRWAYVLEDDPPGSPPSTWEWKGWTRYGRLLLSPEKAAVGTKDRMRILHPILEVADQVPDEAFTRPWALPSSFASR